MNDPVGDDPGLAAARPCQNQHRPLYGLRRFTLLRVKLVEKAHGILLVQLLLHRKLLAFVALAVGPQIVPRINSGLMPIVPVEAYRVLAHALHLLGTQLFLVQRQNRGGLPDWLAWLPVRLLSLLVAGSTRAGIAQPLKTEVRDMPILPINVHSSPSRSVHLDEPWVRQKHTFII